MILVSYLLVITVIVKTIVICDNLDSKNACYFKISVKNICLLM